jgi:hypothetical protein
LRLRRREANADSRHAELQASIRVPARAATLPTGAGRRSSCKSRDRLAPSLARLTRNDRFVCGTAHPWLGSLRGRLGVLAWSGAGGFEPPFGHMLEGPRRGGLRREEDCPRQNRHPKPPQSLTTRSVGHLEREGLTDVGAKCVGLPRRQARSSSCLCVPHALDVEVEHLGHLVRREPVPRQANGACGSQPSPVGAHDRSISRDLAILRKRGEALSALLSARLAGDGRRTCLDRPTHARRRAATKSGHGGAVSNRFPEASVRELLQVASTRGTCRFQRVLFIGAPRFELGTSSPPD